MALHPQIDCRSVSCEACVRVVLLVFKTFFLKIFAMAVIDSRQVQSMKATRQDHL